MDLSKVDKSQRIIAHIKNNKCLLEYNPAFGSWQNVNEGDNFLGQESVSAWEYVIEPSEKKTELRQMYDKFNSDVGNCSCAPGYWELLDKIIDKLEELDD